ncbi:hypothetical protein D3C75_554840 [compost metagenome]
MNLFLRDFLEAFKEIGKVAVVILGLVTFVTIVFGLLAGAFHLAGWISNDNNYIGVPIVVLELMLIAALGFACNNALERWWSKRCRRKHM